MDTGVFFGWRKARDLINEPKKLYQTKNHLIFFIACQLEIMRMSGLEILVVGVHIRKRESLDSDAHHLLGRQVWEE